MGYDKRECRVLRIPIEKVYRSGMEEFLRSLELLQCWNEYTEHSPCDSILITWRLDLLRES